MTKVLRVLPTVGQLVGLVAFLLGFYLLAGLAWTLTVAGAVALVVGVLAEWSAPREGWRDGS